MADAGGTSLHVDNLTRNVEAAHLAEVFAHYGTVTGVDLPTKDGLPLGFAHVEMGTAEEAVNAQAFLDGGQLDGNMLRVNTVLVPRRGDESVGAHRAGGTGRFSGRLGGSAARAQAEIRAVSGGYERAGPGHGRDSRPHSDAWVQEDSRRVTGPLPERGGETRGRREPYGRSRARSDGLDRRERGPGREGPPHRAGRPAGDYADAYAGSGRSFSRGGQAGRGDERATGGYDRQRGEPRDFAPEGRASRHDRDEDRAVAMARRSRGSPGPATEAEPVRRAAGVAFARGPQESGGFDRRSATPVSHDRGSPVDSRRDD